MSSVVRKSSRDVSLKGALEGGARRERGAVDHEIEPAELGVDALEHRLDVVVGADVARQDERRLGKSCRQLPDVFFEPALIGQRQARAARRHGLRDRPGNRTFVGDADDEAALAREIGHVEVERREMERASGRPCARRRRRGAGPRLLAAATLAVVRRGRRGRGPRRRWSEPKPPPMRARRRSSRRRRLAGRGRWLRPCCCGSRRGCRPLSPRRRAPPGWRTVNSGSRRSGTCPSGRGSVARISRRCTGPSSSRGSAPVAGVVVGADSDCAASAIGAFVGAAGRSGGATAGTARGNRRPRARRARRLGASAFGPAGPGRRQHRLVESSGAVRARPPAPWAARRRRLGLPVIVVARRTSCTASASRRRPRSRRPRDWSRGAHADSSHPERHRAEAGVAASSSPGACPFWWGR